MTYQRKDVWVIEKDFYTWETKSGLRGAVIRIRKLGHLAGYVVVPELPHSSLLEKVNVHGGVTWRDNLDHIADNVGGGYEACYLVPRGTLAVGFHCAQEMDLLPAIYNTPIWDFLEKEGWAYRDFDFVKREVEDLADQLSPIIDPAKHIASEIQKEHLRLAEAIDAFVINSTIYTPAGIAKHIARLIRNHDL